MDRFDSSGRIGVFGGTFDPIHHGHLRAAEEARESFVLSKILFIPSAQPPHKTGRPITPAAHRLEMVRKAVSGHPAFEASEVECRRPGASYSVETLHILQEREGAGTELHFILGLDAFLEIPTWRSYSELFSLSHWVVIQRPGFDTIGRRALPVVMRADFRYDRARVAYVHVSGHRVYFRRFRSLEISGTEIRQLVGSGRSIRYLVPEGVEDYIREHSLYSSEEGGPIRR